MTRAGCTHTHEDVLYVHTPPVNRDGTQTQAAYTCPFNMKFCSHGDCLRGCHGHSLVYIQCEGRPGRTHARWQ